MAKRFIDTGLFDDEWFSSLSSCGKLGWVYLLTKCDHAGIISINQPLFKFQTGCSWLTVRKELGKCLVTLPNGKYFLPKFLEYQYPKFPKSKAPQQLGAIEILKKNNIWDEKNLTVSLLLPNSNGDSNGDSNGIEVEMEEEKDKEKVSKKKFIPPSCPEVEIFFCENGYKTEAGKKAWHYYQDADWRDSSGKPVLNWKQKMRGVWFKPENKSDKQTVAPDPNEDF